MKGLKYLFGVLIILFALPFFSLACGDDKDEGDILRFPGNTNTIDPPYQYVRDGGEEDSDTNDDDDDDNDDGAKESWEVIFEDDFTEERFGREWPEHKGLVRKNGELSTDGEEGVAIVGLDLSGTNARITADISLLEASESAACEIVARAESAELASSYRGRVVYKNSAWSLELERSASPTDLQSQPLNLKNKVIYGAELRMTLYSRVVDVSLYDLDGAEIGALSLVDDSPLSDPYCGIRLVPGNNYPTSIDRFTVEERVKN
ncbi:MAG: hypothetical protein Kow0090_22860 [Myxococcota bacterium]